MAGRAVDLGLRTLTLEQNGRVLTARFASPPHHFVNVDFAADWDELTRAVDRDPSVGAVVITGATEGRFLTHFDVAELAEWASLPAPPMSPAGAAALARLGRATCRLPGVRWLWLAGKGRLGRSLVTLDRLHRSILRMHGSGAVYLAAVNGPCLGGGLEIALACDLRIAAEGATFGQVEILGGIIPGAGGTQHLPRVVGTAKALELILDGAELTAQDALEAGLVSRVVPAADLLPQAQQLAARLATRSPVAVAAAKRAVWTGAARPLARGLYVEAGGLMVAGKTPEARQLAEAFAADLEKLGDSPFVRDHARWHEGRR